jgi:AP2-associated kinase
MNSSLTLTLTLNLLLTLSIIVLKALGCLLYKLAYYRTPFEEGGKLKILNADVEFPNEDRYSKTLHSLISILIISSFSHQLCLIILFNCIDLISRSYSFLLFLSFFLNGMFRVDVESWSGRTTWRIWCVRKSRRTEGQTLYSKTRNEFWLTFFALFCFVRFWLTLYGLINRLFLSFSV